MLLSHIRQQAGNFLIFSIGFDSPKMRPHAAALCAAGSGCAQPLNISQYGGR